MCSTLFRSLLRSESGGASGRSRRFSFPQDPLRTVARGSVRGRLTSPAWFFHFTTPLLVVVGTRVWSAGGLVKDALEGSQASASWSFLQKTLITGRRTSGVVGHYGMRYSWRNNLISFELVSGNLNYFTEKRYIDLYSWYFIYELGIFQVLNDLYHQAPAVTCVSRAGSRRRKYMQKSSCSPPRTTDQHQPLILSKTVATRTQSHC